jgi:hypothetical protein
VTGPSVVIRYGGAYSDAVIDYLASEVARSGLSAELEPFGGHLGALDLSAWIVVEPAAGDGGVLPGGVLLTEGMMASWDAVVATARRRQRRQQASGELRDVVVTLLLPGDIEIVVTPDIGEDHTLPLMTALAERLAAGRLTAGRWWWDPDTLKLAAVDVAGPTP